MQAAGSSEVDVIYAGKLLTGRIELDGNEFIDCVLNNCVFIYSGGPPPRIDGCDIHSPKFEFKGAAENTLRLLQSFSDPKSGFQGVLRNTFPALKV